MPFDSTLDSTTEIILGAIEYLEQHGLHKGDVTRADRVCPIGALLASMGDKRMFFDLAVWRIKEANGIETSLAVWSDAVERTEEQVIAALYRSLG